jgi:hypothetical protein
LEIRAKYAFDAVQEVYEKYLKQLPHPIEIMSDGGSENIGISQWIHTYPQRQIKHIVAQYGVEFSNSMADSANRMLKYYGLYQMNIDEFVNLQRALDFIANNYQHRPNNTLNGLTPQEVLTGKTENEMLAVIKPIVTREMRQAQNRQSYVVNSVF